MSEEIYPDLQQADMVAAPSFNTEEVDFETGWRQRNALWNHPIMSWSLRYRHLFETAPTYQDAYGILRNFYLRHRGRYEAFWFEDFTDLNPRARHFGVGDGVTRIFKLQHDWNENLVIRLDGAPYAGVFVDPENGWVLFDVAPADGVVLTYDADDCRYRTRFGDDSWRHDRFKYSGAGGVVNLEQVVDLEDQYPISQEIFGGTVHNERIDAIGEAVAYSFACPLDITVSTICYYSAAQTAPGTVRVGIYTNVDGAPGVELISATHVPGGGSTWQQVAVVATALAQNTRYWIVIEADSGVWGGANHCDVRYSTGVPVTVQGIEHDCILYGAYQAQDRYCKNTPRSWLGVRTRSAAGVWTDHARADRPAFWLNVAGTIAGHCQSTLAIPISGLIRTRQVVVVNTVHDITLDRVGAVFSTVNAPADSLYYRLEVLSAPGVTQRTGTLSTPITLGNVPVYIERYMSSPFTITVGDTLYVDFYSPLTLAGAPWWHWAHYDRGALAHFSGGWVAAWNLYRYGGANSRGYRSVDSGATWPLTIEGAFTLKCRGWWEG